MLLLVVLPIICAYPRLFAGPYTTAKTTANCGPHQYSTTVDSRDGFTADVGH